MSGQVQHPNTVYSGSHAGDSTETVMTRWLQSAGLQHLASPTASSGLDPRFLPNLMMQDYAKHGSQPMEDKQKLLRLLKVINSGVEPAADLVTLSRHGSGRQNGVNGLSSPELRGEIGAGILDVHAIDDIELLSADVVHEPFEASPFAAVIEKGYENDTEGFCPIRKSHVNDSSPMRPAVNEKEITGRDSAGGLARIKVVVRKRPLNKKEISRKEEDIVSVNDDGSSLTVHEPKLKVDLTAYVEKHDFVFDAVLDDRITNDEVYRITVAPIIPTIFQRTKATCFAYGQTGSGKTFTMQPLPIKACQAILNLMQHRSYKNQGLRLWLSFFEIYGGKLFDLLNDRRKLLMREDGKQQVCIVGLKEFAVSEVQLVKDLIEKGNASRSTGSTGANEESSRSHAILQLVIKKYSAKKEEREGKLVGKFSFIDLAGSERGADTTDNDRQTRIEGAEINKSLLALKECIRALDHEQGHIPFRGSKLTEVLRDSFVGDSRTVMISCISPNTGSCEHTLNTLRYADRVKGLSKSSSWKRDPSPNAGLQAQRDSATSPPSQSSGVSDSNIEQRDAETLKRPLEQVNWHTNLGNQDGSSVTMATSRHSLSGEDNKRVLPSHEKDPTTNSPSIQHNSSIASCMVRIETNRVSPPQQKVVNDDELNSCRDCSFKEETRKERNNILSRLPLHREHVGLNSSQSRLQDAIDLSNLQDVCDDNITAILQEEEDLVAAHRLEVEETMELVRDEMKLLTEVDRPGSRIDQYVSQLGHVLSRKAEGIINLQSLLARFQRRLKEEEIFTRNMGGRNMESRRL